MYWRRLTITIVRIGISAGLIAWGVTNATAQVAPSADSLVAHFIKRGIHGNWSPHQLLKGCPDLVEWQQRGIDLLVAADLTEERAADLALSWMFVLTCRNSKVEQWYFERINAEIAKGGESRHMLRYWQAMEHGDSPAIREYLWNLMVNVQLPEHIRSSAGSSLFMRFGPEERRQQYLRAFDAKLFPMWLAYGQSEIAFRHDPDGFLRLIGDRIRQNPRLTDQPAFQQIVVSCDRYASDDALRGFADALRAAAKWPGLNAREREQFEETAFYVTHRKPIQYTLPRKF